MPHAAQRVAGLTSPLFFHSLPPELAQRRRSTHAPTLWSTDHSAAADEGAAPPWSAHSSGWWWAGGSCT
eukprot:8197970-Pyramimonas_sp.AAC.1